MHLNWVPLFILYNQKMLKSPSEKGEMERAVENGSVTISFQGKWGRKNRVLPTQNQCSLSSVTSDAVPPAMVESLRGEVTRRHRKKFHMFSKPVLSRCYLHSLFILSVLGPEGLPGSFLSVCVWIVATLLLSSIFFKVSTWFAGEMHIDLLAGKTQHHYSILCSKSYASISFQLCRFCLHKWANGYRKNLDWQLWRL